MAESLNLKQLPYIASFLTSFCLAFYLQSPTREFVYWVKFVDFEYNNTDCFLRYVILIDSAKWPRLTRTFRERYHREIYISHHKDDDNKRSVDVQLTDLANKLR